MSQPTVEPGTPTGQTQQARNVLAASAQYQAEQSAAIGEMVAAILAVWALIKAKDVLGSWSAGLGERIYVLLSTLQELIARDSNSYTRDVLALQDLEYNGPDIDPLNFAGIASDGRGLESLLAGSVVTVRQLQRGGLDDAEALRRGASFLETVARTQASDAGRAAESVSLVASQPTNQAGRRVEVGWVRVLTPPSCGRCTILAGKFYRWNDGFERHPNCDCRHVTVTEAMAEKINSDPRLYFDSLTEEEQDYYFGPAVAQAIRDGADIERTVNAATRPGAMYTADDGKRYTRELARRNGFYGYRADAVRRPTPWQIYRDAKGSKEKAIAALIRFGYILGQGAGTP